MEKNNDLSVHHAPRSMQAVLSDGYRLYAQNFTRLVRSSWIQAVIYALTTGACVTYYYTRLLPLVLSHDASMLTTLAIWLGTGVIFLLAAILFAFAGGVAPLHDHFQSGAIHSPRRWWGRWPWRLMLKGLTTLPRMLWQVIRHQLGALIVVTLVTALVTLVASAILELPALILSTANMQAQVGLAAGDAVDLPENFAWINFATFSFCGLLQAYIHLSTLFPLYYVWGNTCIIPKETRR